MTFLDDKIDSLIECYRESGRNVRRTVEDFNKRHGIHSISESYARKVLTRERVYTPNKRGPRKKIGRTSEEKRYLVKNYWGNIAKLTKMFNGEFRDKYPRGLSEYTITRILREENVRLTGKRGGARSTYRRLYNNITRIRRVPSPRKYDTHFGRAGKPSRNKG